MPKYHITFTVEDTEESEVIEAKNLDAAESKAYDKALRLYDEVGQDYITITSSAEEIK